MMMRLLIPLALACFLASAALGQRFDVSGTVADTTGAALGGASVVVLQPADSSLVAFGITRQDGAFRIERVPAGEHVLQISFLGFAAHTQAIEVRDRALDVGQVVLREDVAGLDALVVTADHIPMVVRQDTLEYNAGAFTVPPNANVEDLLRRMPGIEVDRDGTIRAQGEEVRQVLVDGREFFGNDPTVATRNLPADAIDRVQVYDKRSDAAEFTGVDDGEEQRTINLALRPDRRTGYFGNASGGVGDERRYDGQASINRFSPSTQFSFIGNANNVNRQGFGVGDYVNFIGGARAMGGGRGRGISISDAPVSSSLASGFSNTVSAGLNFSHEWREGTSLRASYIGHYLDHEQDRSVLQRQLFGAASAATTEQQADQFSRQLSHRLNVVGHYTFTDGHDLRLRSNLRVNSNDLDNWSDRATRNDAGALENTSLTDYVASGGTLAGDAALTYRLRLAPGRSIVAEVQSRVNDTDNSAELEALNQFYRDGNVLTSEEISQLQSQLDHTFSHGQKLTYTEPLGTNQLLQFELEHRQVQEDQDRAVFDRASGAPILDPALSTGFERSVRYLTAGASFRRSMEGLTLRFGVDLQQAQLDGILRDGHAELASRFVSALPSATVSYSPGNTTNAEVRYSTATREPSMRDLQPFADNRDPLNVYVGNPALRPEYTHSMMLRVMRFDPFTQTNLFVTARAGYTLDRIVRSRTFDDQLRQISTTVNADGDWSLSGSVMFGTLIRPLGVRINASNNTMYNRGIEFINGDENLTHILRNTIDVRLENRDKDVIDAQVGTRLTYNDVRYGLNPQLDRRYVNSTYYGDLAVSFLDAWRVRSQLEYNVYARDVFGSARNVPMLHAEVSRMLMANRGQVVLSIRDVLDQSVGVNYSNTATYIQEERIHSLGRYVMLKFVYNLRGGAPRPGRGGVQVIGV